MTYTKDQLKDLRDAIDAHLAGKPVQAFISSDWKEVLEPSFDTTYRWRPKPEPEPPKLWDCMADVPGPVCWFRMGPGDPPLLMIGFCGPDYKPAVVMGITVCVHNRTMPLSWEELAKHWEHSTDRTDDASWKSCFKQ